MTRRNLTKRLSTLAAKHFVKRLVTQAPTPTVQEYRRLAQEMVRR